MRFVLARSFPTIDASASSGWSAAPWERAFDMEGGFNDVAIGVAADASVDDVMSSELDRLLEPYGRPAPFLDRCSRQPGHWTTS